MHLRSCKGEGLRHSPRQGNPLCYAACGGGAREGTMQLSNRLCVSLQVSPTTATPALAHSQLWVSVFPLSQSLLLISEVSPAPQPPCCSFSELSPWSSLPVWLFWFIFFFNSLAVRVPCTLIFWHFWLCEEAKGFYLCLQLGRNSRFSLIFHEIHF